MMREKQNRHNERNMVIQMKGQKRAVKASRENRMVQYGAIQIPFTLVKSNRKTYALSVAETGEVTLRAPFCASERFISSILTERRGWLTEHYRKAQEKAAAKEAIQGSLTPEQKSALDARYRQAAREYIPRRVEHYLPMTGGRYERITIRAQKTRWGSCSARGTLSFNWKLMLAPPDVLDYVVVHELCHLTHMNHSREFWEAVERVMPDYRTRRRWLKEHGSELDRRAYEGGLEGDENTLDLLAVSAYNRNIKQ